MCTRGSSMLDLVLEADHAVVVSAVSVEAFAIEVGGVVDAAGLVESDVAEGCPLASRTASVGVTTERDETPPPSSS